MSGLEDLYREIILDHYRSPRNRGELETPPAHRVEGFNPLCGDEIIVYLQLDDPSKGDDAVITDIRLGGQGCSISQSSGSMMSAAVKGRTVGDVRGLTKSFKSMMSLHEEALDGASDQPGVSEDDSDEMDLEAIDTDMGELEALRGVVKFPVRIKCATLSWNTLSQAIRDSIPA